MNHTDWTINDSTEQQPLFIKCYFKSWDVQSTSHDSRENPLILPVQRKAAAARTNKLPSGEKPGAGHDPGGHCSDQLGWKGDRILGRYRRSGRQQGSISWSWSKLSPPRKLHHGVCLVSTSSTHGWNHCRSVAGCNQRPNTPWNQQHGRAHLSPPSAPPVDTLG